MSNEVGIVMIKIVILSNYKIVQVASPGLLFNSLSIVLSLFLGVDFFRDYSLYI